MSIYTYIIRAIGTSHVKIGKAQSVKCRLKGLQTSNPYQLEVLMVQKGDTEGLLHNQFRPYWIRGEWYEYSDSIKGLVEANILETQLLYNPKPTAIRLEPTKMSKVIPWKAEQTIHAVSLPPHSSIYPKDCYNVINVLEELDLPVKYMVRKLIKLLLGGDEVGLYREAVIKSDDCYLHVLGINPNTIYQIFNQINDITFTYFAKKRGSAEYWPRGYARCLTIQPLNHINGTFRVTAALDNLNLVETYYPPFLK